MLKRLVFSLLFAVSFGSFAHAYAIILKTGARIIAKEKYVVDKDKAIFTYPNGTKGALDLVLIDVETTDSTNLGAVAGELELGAPIKITPRGSAPGRKTLQDVLREEEKNKVDISAPTPTPRAGAPGKKGPVKPGPASPAPIASFKPVDDSEVAHRFETAYRDIGLNDFRVLQGEKGSIHVEVTTEDEQKVFNTISATANALHAALEKGKEIAGVDLLLRTASKEPAGRFHMTPADADAIVSQRVAPPKYFADNVKF